MAFLSEISSGIENTLKIRNIRTRGSFRIFLAVFFRGESFSIRLIEIPRFNIFSLILYNSSVRLIDESADISRSLFIAISEVFLEHIRIIGAIVGFSWELTIRGIYIPVSIASSSDEDSFYFFSVIGIRDFSESLQVILERELIYDKEFSIIIHDMESSAEFIIVVGFVLIPGGRSVPSWYFENGRCEADLRESHLLLSEPEKNLIGSIGLESKFDSSLEGTRKISERNSHRF
jgi:hypothetical protein